MMISETRQQTKMKHRDVSSFESPWTNMVLTRDSQFFKRGNQAGKQCQAYLFSSVGTEKTTPPHQTGDIHHIHLPFMGANLVHRRLNIYNPIYN